jgi:Secretion system C-terminal sorting domain
MEIRSLYRKIVALGLWCVLMVSCGALPAQYGFQRTYASPTEAISIYGLMPLANGDVILSGSIDDEQTHCYNIRVDSHGNPRWDLDTSILYVDFKWQEANLGDSLFFEAGMTSLQPQYMSNPFIHCYDDQGNTRWIRQYDSYEFDQFTDLAVSKSGQIFAVGPYYDIDGHQQAFMLRLDIFGNEIWRRDFPNPIRSTPNGLAILQNGNILLGVMVNDTPHLMQIDTVGTILNDRAFPDRIRDWLFGSMKQLPNGHIICRSGTSTLCEFTTDGNLIRSSVEEDRIYHALPTADGGLLLQCVGADGSDFILRKLRADWTEVWSRSYFIQQRTFIQDLAELPSGDFLICGSRANGANMPMVGLLIRTDCEGNITDYRACQPPQAGFALWPNPNDGLARLAIPADATDQLHTVQVYDAMGKRVLATSTIDAPFLDLDLSLVDQGVYFLRVLQGTETVWQSRWAVLR